MKGGRIQVAACLAHVGHRNEASSTRLNSFIYAEIVSAYGSGQTYPFSLGNESIFAFLVMDKSIDLDPAVDQLNKRHKDTGTVFDNLTKNGLL